MCNAIHTWEGALMEMGWRRRHEVEKKNFLTRKAFYIVEKAKPQKSSLLGKVLM